MCSKVTCEICKKATWSGCGEHIEEALKGVAEADRCTCRSEAEHSNRRLTISENNLNAD